MHILVLGSGAGGGIPQWNSNALACRRARAGDPGCPPRSQSSVALSADGESWFLFNASPDLRQQIIDNPPLHPRTGFRHSPIAGAVVTNGDIDHVTGLLTMREGHAFTLWGTGRVMDVLSANSVFNVLNPEKVARRKIRLDEPFDLTLVDGTPTGLTVEAFAVPGKVALYLEDAAKGANFGTVEEDTVGLKISQPGGRSVFYMPACARMTPELAERLKGADLVFFDGTLWADDELVRQGGMPKSGARMGHMNMSGESGTLEAFQSIGVTRKIFIHINNSNPVLLPESPERAQVLAAGWDIAHDGMEIEL
jgi:pyrroloquinoline quinone biosynthesis protein B